MATRESMKGNQNAVKHGIDGAIKRASEGKPFIGLAAEEEKAVIADIDQMGIAGLKKSNAIRLQTIQNLIWNALVKALQDNDLATAERYMRLQGWLSSKVRDGWKDVLEDLKQDDHKDAVDVINTYRKGVTNDNDS